MTDSAQNPASSGTASNPGTSADPAAASAPNSGQRGATIHIGDEFGTAKRNLPPVRILGAAVAGLLIFVGIVSFITRAKPQGNGSLDIVTAVDLPGQNSVLVALTFTLRNTGKKSIWVHNVAAKLVTPSGESSGDAVSAVDFDRYYQAFPALKENALAALSPEDKLQPGEEIKRTVMVGFPVTLDTFNQRKTVSVVVQPYDQPVPITLTR
jgi:hypothetical protein